MNTASTQNCPPVITCETQCLDGLHIFLGRLSGADDDTPCVVEAEDLKMASTLFERHLRATSRKAENTEIITVACSSLEQAIRDRINDPDMESIPAPSLDDLYLVTGRVCGDQDDTLHIVHAIRHEAAEEVFIKHLQTQCGGDSDTEVFVIELKVLTEAISESIKSQ